MPPISSTSSSPGRYSSSSSSSAAIAAITEEAQRELAAQAARQPRYRTVPVPRTHGYPLQPDVMAAVSALLPGERIVSVYPVGDVTMPIQLEALVERDGR